MMEDGIYRRDIGPLPRQEGECAADKKFQT